MSVKNTMSEFKPGEPICENAMVSVVVPVYNVGKYLERCLESIINQTFKDIEIICVDDGSTDNSGEILDKFAETDSRIVAIHKENGGVSSARNTALSVVRGRYVLFVDADDWIERNTIEELVSHMTDEIDIVVAGAKVDDEGGDDASRLEELNKYFNSKLSGIFRLDDSFIDRVTVVVWNKLFKYDIIKEKGLTFLDGRQYEDNHFTVEYLVHSRTCYFIKKDLYHYVRKPNSIMNKEYNYRDCLYVFDHLYKRLDKFGLLKKYKQIISKRYSEHLRLAYENSLDIDRNDVMELATFLTQNYNPAYFNSELILHVRNREYCLVPQFDKNVLIILKTKYEALSDAFKTIKSLFSQSYRMPKILLYIDTDSVEKEKILLSLPEELFKHVDKKLLIELGDNFSLEDTVKESQGFVVVTVESGAVYSPKWLRCVMAAYSDNKEAFASYGFDSLGMVDDAILFRDFTVFDVGVSGEVTIFKPKQTIVSMTSYPARINSAPLALETVFKQTKKPDKVILWLAESQFPNRYKDLPEGLLRLVSEKGLEIRWCKDDLKPHKKYFYAFREFSNALVITVDDDLLYPPERIENLFLSYLLHPCAVSAARAHLIPITESGEILPYKLWPQEINAYIGKPSFQLFATCGAGALHPTVLFSQVKDLLDKEAIKRTCLNADDLWLKAMQLVAGVPVVIAEDFQGLQYTPDSQEVGLWYENVNEGGNDRQLLQIEEEIDRRYGEGVFRKKLMDTTNGENLIGAATLSKLVGFYKGRANKQVNQIKQQYAKYKTLRVDIRNKGDEGCNVIEQFITPAPVSLRRPTWVSNGFTMESEANKLAATLRCLGDGELEIILMGQNVQNNDGKRYPVWIDCTYFAINGTIVFNSTKTVCYDKNYIYRKAVKDGEIIKLEVVWSECRSSTVLDEYRQLQTHLRKANAKVSSTETALKNANAKVSSTEAALKKANAEIISAGGALKKANTQVESLKNKLLTTTENNRDLEKKNLQLRKKNDNLENSLSFKIGRMVTFFPRKIRDFF